MVIMDIKYLFISADFKGRIQDISWSYNFYKMNVQNGNYATAPERRWYQA